jgi:2-polyprenyl-3-methyl-5-hydroxy-6-metoxy-1,4-benzoquinol methylase
MSEANAQSRSAWNANARFWDEQTGNRILDIACGNGLTSRRLAKLGARVTAFDFSEAMIGRFDAALCNMAFMDMADLHPLMHAAAQMLGPGGAFVFSILHPCFNNPRAVQVAELGNVTITYSVKVSSYLTPYMQHGVAMHDQPEPHPYFHRPLSALIATAADAGAASARRGVLDNPN